MIGKGLWGIILAFASLALLVSPASAVIINFEATLTGAQEVPPTPSPATGSGSMTLDTTTNEFTWYITWSGLIGGSITGFHFHAPAPPGQNAPVIVPIADIISPSEGMVILTDQQEGWLLDGLVYVNLHTQLFPGGEIRGQVLQVPEPATGFLFASLLPMFYSRTRRRLKDARRLAR